MAAQPQTRKVIVLVVNSNYPPSQQFLYNTRGARFITVTTGQIKDFDEFPDLHMIWLDAALGPEETARIQALIPNQLDPSLNNFRIKDRGHSTWVFSNSSSIKKLDELLKHFFSDKMRAYADPPEYVTSAQRLKEVSKLANNDLVREIRDRKRELEEARSKCEDLEQKLEQMNLSFELMQKQKDYEIENLRKQLASQSDAHAKALKELRSRIESLKKLKQHSSA